MPVLASEPYNVTSILSALLYFSLNIFAAKAEETLIASLLHNPDFYFKIKDKVCDEDFATQLNNKTVVIKAKAGESGKLFGAISNKDVADAIKAQFKIDIDKKKIVMDPIKAVGEHTAEIRIYTGVVAKITVKTEV